MYELRALESIRRNIKKNIELILLELLDEIATNPSCESLEFPSHDLMDLLEIYEGSDRRRVLKALENYAFGIRSVFDEYSLMRSMMVMPYLRGRIFSTGDLILQLPPRPNLTIGLQAS